jgi:hypothetical protein
MLIDGGNLEFSAPNSQVFAKSSDFLQYLNC